MTVNVRLRRSTRIFLNVKEEYSDTITGIEGGNIEENYAQADGR